MIFGKDKNGRIVWLDLVRLIALLMVISAHCVDIFNATPQEDSNNAFWGAFIGSLMRPSVPLFAMMTGLLLLPVRESASQFYRRRIPRVLFPMLIWSAIYYMVPWVTGLLGLDKEIVTIFFPFEFSPSQEAGDMLKNIAMIPLNIRAMFILPFPMTAVQAGEHPILQTKFPIRK